MYWHHVTRVERITSAMPVNDFRRFATVFTSIQLPMQQILENSAFGGVHSQPLP